MNSPQKKLEWLEGTISEALKAEIHEKVKHIPCDTTSGKALRLELVVETYHALLVKERVNNELRRKQHEANSQKNRFKRRPRYGL